MNSTDLECETPLQTSCRNAKLENETSSETKPIIIGATIGALFICLLICALIVFCKRRKKQDQDGADEEQVSVSDGNLKTVETKFDDGTTSENQLKTTSDSGRDEKISNKDKNVDELDDEENENFDEKKISTLDTFKPHDERKYELLVASCQDSSIHDNFPISKQTMHVLHNENFTSIEQFYLLNNQLVEEFFTRHENIKCIDAANLLRSIAYARIIASQTILQEKSLYKSGGNSDFCRICPDTKIKRTQDHCECCSTADCSIDMNCIKSQHHKSHCECCLTFAIHLVTDESYDTYIYQSDKFTTETTDWLDDQEELIAIRSWTAEEKTDFVDLMLKSNLKLADVSGIDRIINSKSPRTLISRLRRFQEISSKTRITDSEEDDESTTIARIQRHIAQLRVYITKKSGSSRSNESDERYDFNNHLKKQKYTPKL